ncbi:YggS family pyridoxal phosphate-dependent enzyme [Ilumatobacter nonamiensis]|uniref:YggS family pyridoxal phosphate-dependent enzyme n=1 Tax=Ilumatobacter nonamiensis TaxID=467093 RepID=UPI00034551E7|nr:YggS family pyridoxal phosphate-dependent enzyme [Ilumatobacter nonamiensis]
MNHHPAEQVAASLAAMRSRIDAVERPWTHPVDITAVTKAFDPSVIAAATTAGCSAVGENYAQDLLSKRSAIEELTTRPRVDFIGHLQSNKVRQIADLVDRWCTVDRPSIAKEIAKRAPGADVLIQVNATGEDSKSGCVPDDVAGLLDRCTERGLNVLGLMTIGPTDQPPEAAAPGFRIVRELVDDLGLSVCSMGMTQDVDVAVACGSTNVRVGSALFGARPGAVTHSPVHHDEDAPG